MTPPIKSADLSGRLETVVTYPPLSEMGGQRRREFQEAPLEAGIPSRTA